MLLAKLEEVLIVGEQRFELGTNQYPGASHPEGFSHLKRFRLDPYPIFTFECDGVTVEKHVCMIYGENTTVLQYKVLGDPAVSVRLELRPLIAFRDYHALTHENDALDHKVQQVRGRASVTPYPGMPTLHLAHNASGLGAKGDWYRNFQYAREQERGLDFEEDLFNPFALAFTLDVARPAMVIASTQVHKVMDADALVTAEVARRRAVTDSAFDSSEVARILTLAVDQFIVRRGKQKTVIAGYHWFGDWGRDTMIAVPVLTLALGRTQDRARRSARVRTLR